MPGPAKQFDREQALSKAMAVFWQRGFEGTSIQNLVDAIGINRSSLYATFGDKDALFLEALKLYIDCHLGEIAGRLYGDAPPLDRIEEMIRFGQEKTLEMGSMGCFAANTVSELGRRNVAANELVQATFTRIERQLRRVLDEAVERGDLPAGTDTAAMSAIITTTLQGMSVMSRVDEQRMAKAADALVHLARSSAFAPAHKGR